MAIDCVVPLAFSKSKAKFADVAGVDEAKQDFMEVVEFLKKQFLLFICDGARVRHRRPTGPSPALPDFWISTDRGPPWGVPGRVRHRRPAGSLVPCTGGTGTTVLWFPAWGERGLEEEHCAAASERRGGGGQRREEKRDLDWS